MLRSAVGIVAELAAEQSGGVDYTGQWITAGAAALASALLFLGGIVTRRMRGPTPYEALAARLADVEKAQKRDSRHIWILSNAFDVVWRLNERLSEAWGTDRPKPMLSAGDAEFVRLARDLQTYGDVQPPGEQEPARA